MMYLADRLPVPNYPSISKNKSGMNMKLPKLNQDIANPNSQTHRMKTIKGERLRAEKKQLIEDTRKALMQKKRTVVEKKQKD